MLQFENGRLAREGEEPAPADFVVWVLYWNPSDHPGRFVLRRQWVDHRTAAIVRDAKALVHTDADALRRHIPHGLVRVPPIPGDDPVIVEHWI